MKKLIMGCLLLSAFNVFGMDCEKLEQEALEIITARQQKAPLRDLIKKYEPMGQVYIKIVLRAYEVPIQYFYGVKKAEVEWMERFTESVYHACLTEKHK